MNKLKPVMVDWIDSVSQSGWGEYAGADLRCTSVGFLIKNDKDVVVLALNDNAYQSGQYITIPKIAVKKIRRLR